MAYSVEIRQKALDYLDKCNNINKVASAFGVDSKVGWDLSQLGL